MNSDDLQFLQNWFFDYCDSFTALLAEDQSNIDLKKKHTREVCRNGVLIAQGLGLNEPSALLAEAVSLFHDVGRFPQYSRFKTFDDSISVNHAALGVKVLQDNRVLRDMPKRGRDILIRSVALHNAFSLPDDLDEETLLFARLIRDADKLDILRVFIEYFDQDKDSRAKAVVLGLPDTPGCSPEVLSSLRNGSMALKSTLKNQNDFKLMLLSWVYDLNFAISGRLVRDRDLISRLAVTLPKDEDISLLLQTVREYIDAKATGC